MKSSFAVFTNLLLFSGVVCLSAQDTSSYQEPSGSDPFFRGIFAPLNHDAYRELVRSVRREKFPEALSKLPSPPSHMGVVRSAEVSASQAQMDRIEQLADQTRNSGEAVIPDHYIVRWKESVFPFSLKRDGESLQERVDTHGRTLNQKSKDLVSSLGGEIYYTYNVPIAGFAAALTPAQVNELRRNPDIEAVEPDVALEPCVAEQSISDPGYWGLDRIDEDNISTENVYRYPRTGAGVHVYVIDTGIATDHPEFNNPCRIGEVYGDFGEPNGSWRHGTHVAGIIGGNTCGVAKGVIIHPVKLTSVLSELISRIGWIITVHEYTADPSVVNMSFSVVQGTNPPGSLESFRNAVLSLIEAGFVVVVAAGNYGTSNLLPPASYSEVITVGAVDNCDIVGEWFNDSLGDPGTWEYSNNGPGIDIWAPGVDIKSASYIVPNYRLLSGTSMAAPHVAGVAALYLEANPTAHHDEVKSYLLSTAVTGKITGNLNGAPNRLLSHHGWLYPFYSLEEWQNSDLDCPSSDCWVEREELGGWVWTSEDSYNSGGWFYRLHDNTWIALVGTNPTVVFWNNSNQQYEFYPD